MAALLETGHPFHFHVFTKVPPRFFQSSLADSFSYHALLTDVGCVQKGPLEQDIPATVEALDRLLPFDGSRIEALAEEVRRSGCGLVVCDIAPMGIRVARAAGLPSVLVENFTWDWLYSGFQGESSRLGEHGRYLRQVFDEADHRIQTEPVCEEVASAALVTRPVSRAFRADPGSVREALGVPRGARVVLVTMGGIPGRRPVPVPAPGAGETIFVLPGAAAAPEGGDHRILLPEHSSFFHPDLINASDAVVGKLGYSTLAEVYHAGVPYGYVPAPRFRESGVLGRFIEERMEGRAIDVADFEAGRWGSALEELLSLPRQPRGEPNGARQVAAFILDLLGAGPAAR